MAGGPYISLLHFLRRVATPASRTGQSDEALLERFIGERDQTAFTAIVQRHGPMVLAVCRNVLNNAPDADDAFQATFLVLVRKAASIGKPGSLASWLHGVAYRIASKARVAAARRRSQERQVPIMADAEPDQDTLWRDLRPLLHEEVDRLPERYRKPFVLCHLEGKTNEEAARILGWPKGTVLSSLSRARERLRDRLTRRGVALSAATLTTLLASESAPAAVPTVLVQTTVNTALLFTTAPAVAGISPTVLAHARGILQSMALGRIVALGLAVTAVAALSAGTLLILAGGKPAPALPPTAAVAADPNPPEPEIIMPAEVPAQPDHELLVGEWVVVGSEQHGKPIDEFVKGDRLVLRRDGFSMNAQKGEPIRLFRRGLTSGKMIVDAASKPRGIDFTDRNRTLLAIYALDGDTLKLCIGDPDSGERPTEFASRPDDRQLLLILRRAK